MLSSPLKGVGWFRTWQCVTTSVQMLVDSEPLPENDFASGFRMIMIWPVFKAREAAGFRVWTEFMLRGAFLRSHFGRLSPRLLVGSMNAVSTMPLYSLHCRYSS